jgi:regulator of sigma E protease
MTLDVLAIVGAIVLVLLAVVLVHEGGHFLVGKLCGVRVDEFSVGFGPRIASKRFGETTYSLRIIPAGGFVRMAGMLGLEGEADAGERNFYRASIPKRLATILAGIVSNMLFAGLIFTVLFTLPTGSHIQPGAAAQLAGMRDGDVIVSVDARPIRHDNPTDVSNDLHAATAASKGRPMIIVYTSGGATHTVTVRPSLMIINGIQPPAVATPGAGTASPSASPSASPVRGVADLPVGAEFVVTAINGQPVLTGDPKAILGAGGPVSVSGFLINIDGTKGAGYSDLSASAISDGSGMDGAIQAVWRLGVTPSFDGEAVLPALSDGFGQIPTFVTTTFSDLANLITNPKSGGITGPQGLSGPVGIVRETVTATHQGGRSLAYWIAFVSMNLGLVNVLPIPFLDGGKAFLIILEAIRRRRLDPRREALIYAIGLAMVVLFAIYVTIGDVSRPQ